MEGPKCKPLETHKTKQNKKNTLGSVAFRNAVRITCVLFAMLQPVSLALTFLCHSSVQVHLILCVLLGFK